MLLCSDKSKVNAVGTSPTAVSKVAVRVELLLTAIGTGRLGGLVVTVGMGVHLLMAGSDINNGHVELGQLAALDTLDQDVGAVVVELVSGIGGPREREQALLRVCAAGHVLGDLDGPLVVDVGAGLGVLADDLPGLTTIIRQTELAGSTTMARLSEALWWGELVDVLNFKVPEADGDDLTGLVLCDRAGFVATAGELLSLVTDPGVDGVGGVLGPGTSLGGGVRDGHVGRGRGEEGEGSDDGAEGEGVKGGKLPKLDMTIVDVASRHEKYNTHAKGDMKDSKSTGPDRREKQQNTNGFYAYGGGAGTHGIDLGLVVA